MKRLLLSLLLAALAVPMCAQQAPPSNFAETLAQVLQRDSNGHSPSDDDIRAAQELSPPPSADEVRQALPVLVKALASTDGPVRTFALTALVGMVTLTPQSLPTDPNAPPQPSGPASFRPEIAKALAPALPQIAVHLTEELPQNRALTASILGGFTPNPPAFVYLPLDEFLKREDAIASVGQTVVGDLLALGPLSANSVAVISKYLARSDQTPDSRSNLVDIIGTSPNQNQTLNKALLHFLGSDDPALRARLILTLPQLDLAPDVFTDTKTRVSQLVDNSNESLQVINAAKAVAPCWTAVKMTSGCPVY